MDFPVRVCVEAVAMSLGLLLFSMFALLSALRDGHTLLALGVFTGTFAVGVVFRALRAPRVPEASIDPALRQSDSLLAFRAVLSALPVTAIAGAIAVYGGDMKPVFAGALAAWSASTWRVYLAVRHQERSTGSHLIALNPYIPHRARIFVLSEQRASPSPWR
jgi:hypothetical protein